MAQDDYGARPWLASYDPGVPADVPPEARTCADLLAEGFAHDPKAPCVHYLGRTVSHLDMEYYARRFASYLMANGCRPGDVVAVHVPNIPAFLISLAGALRAGCAVTGVSVLLTPNELVHQLNDSGARVLVTWDVLFMDRVRAVADEIPGVEDVLICWAGDFLPMWKQALGRVTGKIPGGKVSSMGDRQVMYFSEAILRYRPKIPPVEIRPEDPCLIMYTGGTTGTPKGTVLTHANIAANIAQVRAWTGLEPGGETMCSGFPLFHLAGLMFGLATLATGNAQCLVPDPRDTGRIAKIMKKHRPTILANVPTLYKMLLAAPDFRALDHSRLRVCISGAAPFAAEDIRTFEDVVGAGKVLEVYGMTETSPVITANPYRGQGKPGSVGLPLPSTHVRLVSLEDRETPVPQGEEGELVVSGPQVMAGYLENPEETAHALREADGRLWLHTGDVARMDAGGYFYIVDRAKDMLNVGGYKVFSREVEEHLYAHPAVQFCAVVAGEDPERGGDLVRAVIQVAEEHRHGDRDALAQSIREHCRRLMAPYKVPRSIEFTDSIPLTNVGKVDKKALRN